MLFFGCLLLCVGALGYSVVPLSFRCFFLGCWLMGTSVCALAWSEPWSEGVAGGMLLLGAHAAASTQTFFGVRTL